MSLHEKQHFLTQAIINKNYDHEEFEKFAIQSNPHNGVELEKWSLEGLQDVVKCFIASKQEQEPLPENNQQPYEEVKQEQP